ncbi:NAD(+) synthase [uncultured Alistipes sp.]|uniref:NAD(+) synthase n=1 Tax=uncultured Alistipes sp. TaxID=538949 RepID=UPI002617A231|nr:NAD(+) synthase [uncultured Alistipes sp.]
MDRFGFLKVAAAIPHLRVGDCDYNAGRMTALAEEAAQRGAEIVVFPELSLTGYTCGDLLLQPTLLDAAEEALEELVRATRKLPLTLIAGAPLCHGETLYNCAVVFTQGRILGAVPKSYIPGYAEFYEPRWFASGAGIAGEQIAVAGQEADFGTDLTFAVNGAEFGIELCEDLWAAVPPSSHLAQNGARVIFNLSASPEGVGKHDYLRQLVIGQSARTLSAYVYCSAGFGESSTDLVFAGNALIAENGQLLREGRRFSTDEQVVVADVDLERLAFERRRNTSFRMCETDSENTVIEMEQPEGLRTEHLDRWIDPAPFVPHDESRRAERCEEVFRIQSHGLARRMAHTRAAKAVIGISGGLDSTLALLVAVRTFDLLKLDRKGILGITMPGFGTTDRTYRNALQLMQGLGITVREIPIREACLQHFRDIGLDPADRSAAYENAQARERTQILMDIANMEGGLVVGTGDLSELALGWATYNGDQMSMYGVNASVPKTLVRHLVRWVADTESDEATRRTLLDILDTPVSPELLPAEADGSIAQKTEDLVGPYELHDFFLYHLLRTGSGPAKTLFLAGEAFGGRYDETTIRKWLGVFIRRFFAQQFKRSAMPDGPKVGSVALSPRGDWRMPSDATAAAWLRELDECKTNER